LMRASSSGAGFLPAWWAPCSSTRGAWAAVRSASAGRGGGS
jgi:hypothetical protein